MEVGTEDIRDCDGIWGGGVLSICSACSLIQTSDKAAVTKERDGKRWVENDALCGIISESFGTSSLLSGCGGLKTSWSSASRSKLDRDTSDWPIDRFPGTKGSSNANVLLFFWYRERVGSRYGCISHDQYQNRKETAKTHCYDYVSGSFDLSAIAVQTVE